MANIDQVQLPDGSQYHIIDDTSGYATTTYVQDQISTINKNTIGLGNVDNTADINKPVSLPQQTALDGKVDDDIVAYVESDTTATKRHEVGDQFILNGVLYTATAIIAVNDTIVIGTNCDSAESVATQITENANAIVSLRSDITSINQTGTTATQAISSGTYFYLNGTLVRAKTAIASGATFTLNTNYEVVTVGDALKEENFNLIKINNADTVNSERCVRIGKVVYISGLITFGSAKTGSPITIAKIPSEYAPPFRVPIYVCDDGNDKVGNGQIFVTGGEYLINLYRPSSDTSIAVSKVRFFGVYVQE